MRILLLVAVILAGTFSRGICQLNVALLHQLVEHSKSEYSRQQMARSKQALVTANERVNRLEMGKLKDRYRELQHRFQTLGLVIEGMQVGLEAVPVIEEILDQQERVVRLADNDPSLALLAIHTQQDLAGRARQLGRYLAGLLVCIGDINQMKASERKVLFHHVITELRQIAGLLRGLAATMQHLSDKSIAAEVDPFIEFADRDKKVVEHILWEIKELKP